MLDDLDHVFRNIGRYPIQNDVRIAFNRVLLHSGFYANDARRQALQDFETFGKIVMSQDQSVKPYFVQRFAKAAVALSSAMEKQTAQQC